MVDGMNIDAQILENNVVLVKLVGRLDLKGTLETVWSRFYGAAIEMRLRPGYFPFVEPGFETRTFGAEINPVGDDDYRIKDAPVVGVVQAGELVGQPGDGVALARASGVLDQVGVARSITTRRRPKATAAWWRLFRSTWV